MALWQSLRKTVVFVTHSVFESVYLSQRIVVMTPRPGRVFTELAIDAPYPRDERFRTSADYAGYCRLVSEALAGAMRRGSGMTGDGGARLHRKATRLKAERATKHEAASRTERALRVLLPIVVLGLGVVLWGAVVRWHDIPPYVLPGAGARVRDPGRRLGRCCRRRSRHAHDHAAGLSCSPRSAASALAVLFNQSRLIEYSLYPYAVILQVTPIVAIAPLILIYLPQPAAVLVCAWIVAFFPVLSNTTLGLNSVDHNLADLFRLYGATRWQVLWELKLPAALPYILGGLKIAGGLSLIGAVVAEIVAGSAGAGSGLAYRIVEAGYRLNIPRMFAALLLLSLAGIVIFFALSLVSHLLLRRWHESALAREV